MPVWFLNSFIICSFHKLYFKYTFVFPLSPQIPMTVEVMQGHCHCDKVHAGASRSVGADRLSVGVLRGVLTRVLSGKLGREKDGLSHLRLSKASLVQDSSPWCVSLVAITLASLTSPRGRLHRGRAACSAGLLVLKRVAGLYLATCLSLVGALLLFFMFSWSVFYSVEMFELLSHLCGVNRLINISGILKPSFCNFLS